MESKFIKIENNQKWQDLLNKVLFKTFFHDLDWEEFLERNFKWLKFEHYFYQNQTLLSLARIKIFGKEKLISHPFCEYGGPLPLVSKIDGERFQKDLFEGFKIPLKISFHPQILNFFENVTRSVLVTLRNAYFIENFNQKTEETLWQDLRKTTRHEIKKAQSENLQIKKCETEKELSSFYNLYIKSAKRHKILAYPFSFFEYFLRSSDSEIILVKHNGKVIAGSVFLFYDQFIHYFLNASDEKFKDLGANYLILWNQIQNYSGRNHQVFDFGGTRLGSSLEIFKKGWGGKQYSIFELTNQPQKDGLRDSKLRNILGSLPPFLLKKLSPHLLKYKNLFTS